MLTCDTLAFVSANALILGFRNMKINYIVLLCEPVVVQTRTFFTRNTRLALITHELGSPLKLAIYHKHLLIPQNHISQIRVQSFIFSYVSIT